MKDLHSRELRNRAESGPVNLEMVYAPELPRADILNIAGRFSCIDNDTADERFVRALHDKRPSAAAWQDKLSLAVRGQKMSGNSPQWNSKEISPSAWLAKATRAPYPDARSR